MQHQGSPISCCRWQQTAVAAAAAAPWRRRAQPPVGSGIGHVLHTLQRKKALCQRQTALHSCASRQRAHKGRYCKVLRHKIQTSNSPNFPATGGCLSCHHAHPVTVTSGRIWADSVQPSYVWTLLHGEYLCCEVLLKFARLLHCR